MLFLSSGKFYALHEHHQNPDTEAQSSSDSIQQLLSVQVILLLQFDDKSTHLGSADLPTSKWCLAATSSPHCFGDIVISQCVLPVSLRCDCNPFLPFVYSCILPDHDTISMKKYLLSFFDQYLLYLHIVVLLCICVTVSFFWDSCQLCWVQKPLNWIWRIFLQHDSVVVIVWVMTNYNISVVWDLLISQLTF